MKRTLRSSKSHGGCATCKQRRVKCDEGRPGCLICRANGLSCPGYQKQLRWSSKHEKFRPPAAQQASPARPTPSNETVMSRQPSPPPAETPSHVGSPSATDRPVGDHAYSISDVNPQMDATAGWPSFDVAGFEDFGLSDFPFVDSRTPAWLHRSAHPVEYPSVSAFNTSSAIYAEPSGEEPHPTRFTPDESEAGTGNAQPRPEMATGSKRFLQTYYRMSQPGQVSGLTDEDFVNYYFHNVCTVYSCFDSQLNKFRSLVSDAWTSSPTIYLSIQSMSAGHLANHYPSLAQLGLQKRSQAWRYLQKDLQLHRVGKISTETVLLSLLLLGPSSSWHQVSNLGMQFLFIARNLMQTYLRESFNKSSALDLQNEEFFHEALLRWEMVASFVDPVPFTALAGNMQLPEQRRPTGRQKIFPHPWIGVAPEIHFALAEIGRMLRRRRTHSAPMPGTPQTSGSAYISATDDQWVGSLEGFLREIELPGIDSIGNYEDVRTPSMDLIITADAMRFAGLIEIYDIFPNLLRRHARDATELSGFSFEETSDNSSYAGSLTAMAMHVLETVKPIAITSAACRFLPFILLVAGSRLHLASGGNDTEQEELTQARFLVEARMLLLSRKYAQAPVLRMLDIIKECWQRLDQGSAETHWLDVADEKGWQTLVG